ncbi:EamA family transporter [candidate division KSB1 bacterium]|nr:EamA family transporter [candidate division KSB1 bacterium]
MGAILYSTFFGFLFYLHLIGQIGAGKTAYITLVTPIIAMGMSTVFEGYQWSGIAFVGMVLILAGNVIALRKRLVRAS